MDGKRANVDEELALPVQLEPKGFREPTVNPDYMSSFYILSWQAEMCGHRLIPNKFQKMQLAGEAQGIESGATRGE